jgi:hypothetical protein
VAAQPPACRAASHPAALVSCGQWEPIPPDDSFVALGMVITTTNEAPLPTSVRCLHRDLCRPAAEPPKFLWNDRGLGGTAGSLWTVNNLKCVWATNGYERPRGSGEQGAFWELKEWPFRLSEAIVLGVRSDSIAEGEEGEEDEGDGEEEDMAERR